MKVVLYYVYNKKWIFLYSTARQYCIYLYHTTQGNGRKTNETSQYTPNNTVVDKCIDGERWCKCV